MDFIDARRVPSGTVLRPDLAIIGGGPAGISLALALANTPIRILLLESGGMEFDSATQALYAGPETGVLYTAYDFSAAAAITGVAGRDRSTKAISRSATGSRIPAGHFRDPNSSHIIRARRR